VDTEPLAAFLERVRIRVDEGLEHYLRKPPACPAIVADAMRYSVFAGGKRLRPVLALAAADAVAWNADKTQVLRDAASVAPGDTVHVTLSRGGIAAKVTKTE